MEKFDDIGEEDEIQEYEEIKKKKIKINLRKETEKKENFMCASSLVFRVLLTSYETCNCPMRKPWRNELLQLVAISIYSNKRSS